MPSIIIGHDVFPLRKKKNEKINNLSERDRWRRVFSSYCFQREINTFERRFLTLTSIFDRFPRSLTNTKTTQDTERTHLSEPIPSTNPLTRTTPTPSENMTQQVLRLAEKINDQYLTCKICLVCISNRTLSSSHIPLSF